MNHYRPYSRRKRKKGKWVVVLVILAFAVFKIYNRQAGPALSFGDDSKVAVSSVEAVVEDSILSSMPAPAAPAAVSVADLHSKAELAIPIDNILACIETDPPRIIKARDELNKMLSVSMSEQQMSFVKSQLCAISEKWLFSRTIFSDDKLCGSYKVKPLDRFEVLGKKFNVPYGILMQINNISDPRSLRAGDTIKVINGPFHCKIYRSTFTMDLYLQDTFVRSFSIGIGKSETETPTGVWVVKSNGKLVSPTWTDPDTGKTYESGDSGYPLGARWIGLVGLKGEAKGRSGFAIHGTKNPEQLGSAGSRGCIRLHDEDVKLVYDILRAGVSRVVVVE